LAAAIRKNDSNLMKRLIIENIEVNKLADYSPKSKEKLTLLHVAVGNKNEQAVKLLLQFKANPNIKSFPSGTTPLHIASQWCLPKIVEMLLKSGADPVANDNNGKNPLQIIGNKLPKDDFSIDIMDRKTETQVILLQAGGDKATKVQKEIDTEIANAEIGFQGLKIESNIRVKQTQKTMGKKFDSTHPWCNVTKQRLAVWSEKNGTIEQFLDKKYIKVKIPSFVDKDEVIHLDLSRIKPFQITIAKELLTSAGLNLTPEPKPKWPQKK